MSLRQSDIGPERVIGHADMTPERKADPGPRFDWRRLARQGLSVWPEAGALAVRPDEPVWADFQRNVSGFGYPDAPDDALLKVFRDRFLPHVSGALTALDCAVAADLAYRFPVDRAAALA